MFPSGRRFRVVLAALLVAAAAAPARPNQQSHHALHTIPSVPDELLTRGLPLRTGIGRAHDKVGTSSAEAQAFYDQGLAYLHSYVWIEAARSFHRALQADPRLAVAHAALSVAYTELNAPAKARAALERARALAAAAPDHDRRHIDLRSRQMAAENNPGDAAALTTYRIALDAALDAFPADAELWLLRGNAESSDPADRGQGSVVSAIPFYERALRAAPDGDGALHFLAHAFENAGDIEQALAYGARYAAAASAIPHAQHMHGHVLTRAGRVREAVPLFEAADRLERTYLAAEKIPAEIEWHHEHNLDLLGASYQYLGQMRKAEQALKEAFGLPSALIVQVYNKRNWPMFLTARGRIEEAIAAARIMTGHPSPVARATGHLEVSRALLASKRYKEAADAFNAALREVRTGPPGAALVSPALTHVQGEFFLRTGQREKGEAMFRDLAARLRAAIGPDERMDALFTLDAMARVAREIGHWDLAAWLGEQMLQHDRGYGGAHFARGASFAQRGDRASARGAFQAAAAAWAGADPDLPELAVIKAGLAP